MSEISLSKSGRRLMVQAYRQVNTWLIPDRTQSITQPCWIIIGESCSINDLSNLLYFTLSLSLSIPFRRRSQSKVSKEKVHPFDWIRWRISKRWAKLFRGKRNFFPLILRYAFLTSSFVPSRDQRRENHVAVTSVIKRGGKRKRSLRSAIAGRLSIVTLLVSAATWSRISWSERS